MTLHTQVAITGDIDPAETFAFARTLIGAGPAYRTHPGDPLSMTPDQGLPALLWVEAGDGKPESHDEYCDAECDGAFHTPAHDVMVHFDTAYGYQGEHKWGRRAGCGDLHAYLVREIGRWVEARGGSWRWHDESGDGWNVEHADLGNLGSPRLGSSGLPKVEGGAA